MPPITPTIKSATNPDYDLPHFQLPPSLPKKSVFPNGNDPYEEPIARSLTNNNHLLIPASVQGGVGIKMAQSPTIFSILSGGSHTNPSEYNQTGSMVASSRTYISTTEPSGIYGEQIGQIGQIGQNGQIGPIVQYEAPVFYTAPLNRLDDDYEFSDEDDQMGNNDDDDDIFGFEDQ